MEFPDLSTVWELFSNNAFNVVTSYWFMPFLYAYVLWGLLSHMIINKLVFNAWERAFPNALGKWKEFSWLPQRVGIIERLLYTSAIIFDQFAFIALIIGIKAVGDLGDNFYKKADENKTYIPQRRRANLFLLGSLLSLIFGILGGIIFRWIIDPHYMTNIFNSFLIK